MITLVGTSKESYEAAIRGALADAAKTVRHLDWFEVVEQRGRVGRDGAVEEFQVKISAGFRLSREDA
jgi:hypothetical protein